MEFQKSRIITFDLRYQCYAEIYLWQLLTQHVKQTVKYHGRKSPKGKISILGMAGKGLEK